MKAVKALGGLAHINNHIKILPPITFLIDRKSLETKPPTFKEYFLAPMILEASCPTTYRKSGLSEVTASRMAFATSDGCIAFWIICFDDSDSLIFTLLYGKLLVDSNFDSDDDEYMALAVFIFL